MDEDTTYLRHQTQRNQADAQLENSPLYCLVFIVLTGTLHITGGEKYSSISSSYKPCDLQQQSAYTMYWCNIGTHPLQEASQCGLSNALNMSIAICH